MSAPTPVPAPTAHAPTLAPLPAAGSPTVTVHAVEQPANTIVVIHLRPNGDPTGDSKATFYVNAKTTQADIQAWVAQEKQRVLDEYLATHNAVSTLIAAIGS